MRPLRRSSVISQEACREAPVAEAMATLFAYEGQVPAIAWQKIKGLTENYGFRPDQFEFFSTHLVADIAHSGGEMAAIAQSATDEDAVVAATGKVACEKLWSFLDGCYGRGRLMAEFVYHDSEAWNTTVRLAASVRPAADRLEPEGRGGRAGRGLLGGG